MPFRMDAAADTLGKIIDALTSAWETLPKPTRAAVQQSIMTHGPKIAAANSFNASSAIIELLDAFWAQKAMLPESVVRPLQAGQGTAPALARLMPTVPDATRAKLLDRLATIADFRYFKEPPATAQAVARLVSVHDDRLTPDERTAYNRLYDTFSRGGDPEAFLRAAETLLSGYPAVKTLLDGAKTFVRPVAVVRRDATPSSRHFAHAAPPTAVAADGGGDLTCYANVIFPATVLITQQAVPLIVHVAQAHAQQSVFTVDEAKIALKVGDLTIVVQAEGFVVVGSMGGQPASGDSGGRVVKVEAERDCEPAIFLLTPQATGEKRINVYIDQFGRNILTQAFQVKVVADLAAVRALPSVADRPTACGVTRAWRSRAAARSGAAGDAVG